MAIYRTVLRITSVIYLLSIYIYLLSRNKNQLNIVRDKLAVKLNFKTTK